MKISTSDAIAIAKAFAQTPDDSPPRMIERLRVSHPKPINTLALFRLNKREYALLFDDTAHDNADYIESQIQIAAPGTNGQLLANPNSDLETYGLPYEGKDCYLYLFSKGKQRLDVYLAETYPEYSRSSWQKHIKLGRVKVESVVQTAPRFEVPPDARVEVDLPKPADHSALTLPIIYQDEDVVVIDKPAGVLTHAKNPLDDEFTVAKFAERFQLEKYGTADRSGIVHRLDRDTSGLLIIARNQLAFDYLKHQFAERTVKKTYVAICQGSPKANKLVVDMPIARSPSKPGSFVVDQGGKSAITDVEVDAKNQQLSRLIMRPRTGRTHQLRVHALSLGSPIVGDRLYCQPSDRLYLHAHQLEIELPNGKLQRFSSPVPASFEAKLRGTQP